MKEWIHNSLFLQEAESVKEFASLIATHDTEHFAIVCERKEDIPAIRAQLFHEIKKLKNAEVMVGGVSTYTLDRLAENFCSTFANSSENVMGRELTEYFRRPYMDVVNQEKLVKLILCEMGYVGQDALPLAKQILTFIDLEWPNGYTFLDLLSEAQSSNKKEITERSLKEVLATYQVTSKVLSQYTRLQALVRDYLNQDFISHLEKADSQFIWPRNFLSAHILWVGAPEYAVSSYKNYKPGNFQAHWVDGFRDAIVKAQNVLGDDNKFFHYRTILEESSPRKEHIEYSYALSPRSFEEHISAICSEESALTLHILADYDVSHTKFTSVDAAGPYTITEKELAIYFELKKQETLDLSESSPYYYLYKQIEGLVEEFKSLKKALSSETFLQVSKLYDIRPPTESTLGRFLFGETYTVGQKNAVSAFYRPLYFFPSAEEFKKVTIVGPPHSSKAPSLNLQILNSALLLIQKKGIEVDLLASESTYRFFWNWLLNQPLDVKFILEKESDLNKFPKALACELGSRVYSFGSQYKECKDSFLDTSLKNPFHDTKLELSKLSMTQFEKYVDCPARFYLNHVLHLPEPETDFTKGEMLATGTRVHKLAELFSTRLKSAFPHEKNATSYLKKLSDTTREIVLLPRKEDWLSQLLPISQEAPLQELAREICDEIFKPHSDAFTGQLIVETLKRCFKRLVDVELKRLTVSEFDLSIAHVEYPLSLRLGSLELSGRLDRLDFDGTHFHIVDFKTSSPRKDAKISLFPDHVTTAKLSVQAALYSVAVAKTLGPVKTFSLCKLKVLDKDVEPYQTHTFEPALDAQEELIYKLVETYTKYADDLASHDFSFKPRLGVTTCNFCPYSTFCPKPREEKWNLL